MLPGQHRWDVREGSALARISLRTGKTATFALQYRRSTWFARTQRVPFHLEASDPSARSSSHVGGHGLVRQAVHDQGRAVDPG